jgi:N-acetylneuraminate synthase
MDEKDCKIVAEIGCVHGGSLSRALFLTGLAAKNGADYVKFQKRNPYLSTPDHLKNHPHPNPNFAYGSTYLEHRINLELSLEDHVILRDTCHAYGVLYGCSVWDMESAKGIISLNPDLLKIPSACNHDFDLINYCLQNCNSKIHISLGMTNRNDRVEIFDFLSSYRDRVVLYHCVSEYPCSFDKMQMLGISEIINNGFEAAFSNHGYGIAMDIAAMMLGAKYDERHFVDDRAFRHTDAAASLEPDGLRRLKRDILAVGLALGERGDMTEEESIQAKKMRIFNANK